MVITDHSFVMNKGWILDCGECCSHLINQLGCNEYLYTVNNPLWWMIWQIRDCGEYCSHWFTQLGCDEYWGVVITQLRWIMEWILDFDEYCSHWLTQLGCDEYQPHNLLEWVNEFSAINCLSDQDFDGRWNLTFGTTMEDVWIFEFQMCDFSLCSDSVCHKTSPAGHPNGRPWFCNW